MNDTTIERIIKDEEKTMKGHDENTVAITDIQIKTTFNKQTALEQTSKATLGEGTGRDFKVFLFFVVFFFFLLFFFHVV